MSTPFRARDLALAVLRDVFGPSRRGAQEAFAYRVRRAELSQRDRAFAAELTYGTIKMRRALDWYLQPYIGGRTRPVPDAIGEALRMGAYQIRFMKGVNHHAAVYETVGAALRVGHRGTAGLVNAVLRRLIADEPPAPEPSDFDDDDDYLGTRYSVPTWIVAAWRERFGEQVTPALAGIDQAPQLALRVNELRARPDDVAQEFASRGVSLSVSAFVRDALVAEGRPDSAVDDDPEGRWVLQGESSCMPVDLLDPQRGEQVLDLCSGRGNKALHIAARTQDDGMVTCVEWDDRRTAALAERLVESGVQNLRIVQRDARVSPDEQYDAVLLDAPCSGLGVVGRHPEARWRKRREDGERLAVTQGALLRSAAEATRPGGRLVYSVCTTDRRESEDVVDALFARSGDFDRSAVPSRYAPFATSAGDVLVPPGIEGRDGFYIAVLQRRAGA